MRLKPFGHAICFAAISLVVLLRYQPAMAQLPTPEVLYNFSGQANPMAPLVEGPDGDFYGITPFGPGARSQGSVFKFTSEGAFTVLAEFNGNNGEHPVDLFLGRDGNFYGTTDSGGSSGFGTVFRVTPKSILTTLANFDNSNGSHPSGRLIQRRDGELFGTTLTGTSYYGTLFKVTIDGALNTILDFPAEYGSFPAGHNELHARLARVGAGECLAGASCQGDRPARYHASRYSLNDWKISRTGSSSLGFVLRSYLVIS